MADSVKSFRDGIVTFVDGTGTPNTLVLTDCEGDLKTTVSKQVVEMQNRGVLLDVKRGDKAPVEWSLSIKFRGLEGAPAASTVINDAGGINAGSTSVILADASGFTTSGEGIFGPANGASDDQLEERFSWSGKSSNTLLTLTRGKDGTTAKAWADAAMARQIDTLKRTMAEWLFRRGGYAGLVSKRSTTDIFVFDIWAAVLDPADSVEEIVELRDAYVLKLDVVEGSDYSTMQASGRAWRDYVVQQ